MAAAAFLCGAGSPCRVVWLHNRFYSSSAWGCVAAGVANALELSARFVRAAVCRLVFDSARADNGHGFDATSDDRGPTGAADRVWPRDRFSLRIKHAGCDGWRRA